MRSKPAVTQINLDQRDPTRWAARRWTCWSLCRARPPRPQPLQLGRPKPPRVSPIQRWEDILCFAFLTLGLLCFAAIRFSGDNWDRPNICRPWASNYWRARIRSVQVLFTFDVSCVQDVIVTFGSVQTRFFRNCAIPVEWFHPLNSISSSYAAQDADFASSATSLAQVGTEKIKRRSVTLPEQF